MTYEYVCNHCKHQWEEDQKITDKKTETCPVCKKKSAERLISGGTGFVLKGGGWFKDGGY